MDIVKSGRHAKVIGEFGEAFLSNWLSRSGFEVTTIDHIGLDIIAYHPPTQRRLGITVKSRTRDAGKEAESVNVFSYQKEPSDRAKLLEACEAFACKPWLAVYVETSKSADLYLTSLEHYDQTYRLNKSRAIDTWRMGSEYRRTYDADPDVRHVCVTFTETNWTW